MTSTLPLATFSTFIILALSAAFALYFFTRFLMNRKLVSLGIMLNCTGWAFAALYLNGALKPEASPYVAAVGLASTLFLAWAIILIEYREALRLNRARAVPDTRSEGED